MKNLITYSSIIISFSMMLLGCYSQKKASQNLLKVQAYYPETVASICSSLYPPLAVVKDSIIYLQGEVEEELVYVEVDCDSVINEQKTTKPNVVRVPCPPSIYRTDTLLVYKERQVVDRAAVKALSLELKELTIVSAKTNKENYILLRVAIVLLAYTIIRWVLRIWHIKLP